MKLLNSLKNKKALGGYKKPYTQLSQDSGKTAFLKKFNAKKRGVRKSVYVKRKFLWIWKVFFAVSLLGLLVYAGNYWLFNSEKFEISKVNITGTERYVSEVDVRKICETNSLKKNIFLFNLGELERTLKDNFLGARLIEVSKSYPNTINIYIEERVPMAKIYNDSKTFLIDIDGYILGEVSESSDLPEIEYEEEIKVGGFLKSNLVPVSMEILQSAKEQDLNISSMSFQPKYSKIYVNNAEIIISNEKDIKNSLFVLSNMIEKLTLEGKKIRKIDLRYDKVIVLYD